MAAESERDTQHPAPGGGNPELRKQLEAVDSESSQVTVSDETTAGADNVPEKNTQQQLSRERLAVLGGILVVVAAIFAVTALDAPWYMVYDRGPDDTVDVLDSHIGAPWRISGVSVLWYFTAAAAVAGITLLMKSRRS